MKATKADKVSAARAAAVAKLGKRLDKDAGHDPQILEAVGRGLAGWRVAHTDGSAVILVADATAPPPDEPERAIWRWVSCPAYDLEAVPEAATLAPAVRFIGAASRGQHGAGRSVPVSWSVDGRRLTFAYTAPACDCTEAIAVVPLESLTAGDVSRGCVAVGYLAPLCEGVNVDGWTWSAGQLGAVRVVELRADGFRVLICELKDK